MNQLHFTNHIKQYYPYPSIFINSPNAHTISPIRQHSPLYYYHNYIPQKNHQKIIYSPLKNQPFNFTNQRNQNIIIKRSVSPLRNISPVKQYLRQSQIKYVFKIPKKLVNPHKQYSPIRILSPDQLFKEQLCLKQRISKKRKSKYEEVKQKQNRIQNQLFIHFIGETIGEKNMNNKENRYDMNIINKKCRSEKKQESKINNKNLKLQTQKKYTQGKNSRKSQNGFKTNDLNLINQLNGKKIKQVQQSLQDFVNKSEESLIQALQNNQYF